MGRDTGTSESDSDLSSCHRTSDSDGCLLIRKEHNRTKNHKCDFEGCNKTFNRPWKLEAHKHLHKGQRPFACSHNGCNKAYTNSSHLKRHVKVSHVKSQLINSFRCPEEGCEAVLKTRQFLKRHIKRRHTSLPYECPECKAKFERNHHLKEHTFTHTGVHPFVCEKCNKRFEKNCDLKKHQRCHRTYYCGLQNCAVTFPSMSLYRKHMASVHKPGVVDEFKNNRDFICAVCDKRFTTHGNLTAHYTTHINFSKPMWDCPHENCGSTFSQERYLKQHLEHVHETTHQYKCPVEDCQKFFKWKRSLFHHVKLHSMKKAKVPRKAQKERKDKGLPRKSMAAELANVTLQPHIHKELISNEQVMLVGSDDEVVFEDVCVSNAEELDDCSLKSDISLDCGNVNKLLIGTETVYRIENVNIEVISDCSISESNIEIVSDCSISENITDSYEIVINETKNEILEQKYLEKDTCLDIVDDNNSKPVAESSLGSSPSVSQR